ncbi:hypothetical protein [Paenibacillus wulumuqiensis]|uniref:hypothetical protein n=1 Tax=Paenibacillus wulumuqiensis TaxID=1567107 RepID=UPI000619BA30|nr:hypothetical protein [Paenibacillus wulumuqiensis]
MPYTLTYANENQFDKDYEALQEAEQDKYNGWRNQVVEYGAIQAARLEHIEIKKIRGAAENQWELVIGRKERVQMFLEGENVTILGIGHL